jgi:hypothetical protein
MDRINNFLNGLFRPELNYNVIEEDEHFNKGLTQNIEEIDEKIIDIWSDIENDPLMESMQMDFPDVDVYNETLIKELKKPMPRMISVSGHTYISLNDTLCDTLCDYEKIDSGRRVLTAKNYLKRERESDMDWGKNIKYLEFVNQTYISHMKERMLYFWKASAAAFYLFLNAFFPSNFTYYGTDIIILLSEDILDKYFDALNRQADKVVA